MAKLTDTQLAELHADLLDSLERAKSLVVASGVGGVTVVLNKNGQAQVRLSTEKPEPTRDDDGDLVFSDEHLWGDEGILLYFISLGKTSAKDAKSVVKLKSKARKCSPFTAAEAVRLQKIVEQSGDSLPNQMAELVAFGMDYLDQVILEDDVAKKIKEKQDA